MKRPAVNSAQQFEDGSVAWLVDPVEVFVPVKVVQAFARGQPGKVIKLPVHLADKPVDEALRKSSARYSFGSLKSTTKAVLPTTLTPEETSGLIRTDAKALAGIADMISMTEISEASLLHNLRIRFYEHKVYTAIGSLLVSVNPFHALPLYTPEFVDRYRLAGSVSERIALGPHVFGMAQQAYSNLVSGQGNQSCIVSGESGSGKTEFSKLFLQYLMEVSNPANLELSSLATKILTATQVMEAFGNAKTTRNDNSSRHGKWLSVKFHRKRGMVLGAELQTYLLEKSRLVDTTRSTKERNFHIFYQLLAGAENDWALEESLQLRGGWEAFNYLKADKTAINGDGGHVNNGTATAALDDSRGFEETIRALRVLGMTGEEEGQVLSVLAGVLHLGNIDFVESNEDAGPRIANLDVLAVASELLGLDSELVASCLTKKDLSNSRETLFQNRTYQQACEARDALAKYSYSQLFDYVVQAIGRALIISEDDSVAPSMRSEIGILDIFGFEVFDVNLMEQLLLNYANEALQEKFFNKFLFELERSEYIKQGMSSDQVELLCAHSSTEECLRMFEDRPTGLFASLEDEIALPQTTDQTFVNRFTKTSSSYKCFARPPGGTGLVFKIQHYAGAVTYNAKNILEKSRDRVDPSIENLALSSTSLLGEISKLGPLIRLPAGGGTFLNTTPVKKKSTMQVGSGGNSGGGQQQKTLGTKFMNELGALIESLEQTQPHFARCIKPNDNRSSTEFQSNMVMSQLRYSGLLDVCRVRRSGFPVRMGFEDFAWRYKCLLPNSSTNVASACREIFDLQVLPTNGFFGTDKVLLRDSARDYLEFQREAKVKRQVELIQKVVRGKQVRIQMQGVRTNLLLLDKLASKRTAVTAEELDEMDRLLGELDMVSSFHQTISKARTNKLAQDRKALVLNAIGNTASVQEATVVKREAISNGIAEQDPVLYKINRLLADESESTRRKEDIELAMEARDLGAIERALSFMDPQDKLTADAEALRDRLRQEHLVLDTLERAMRAELGDIGRMENLRTSLHVAMGMGMETHPLVMAGTKLLRKWKRSDNESKDMSAFRLQGTEDAKRALDKLKLASEGHDTAALAEARHQALELGLDRRPDVQRAGRLLKQMDEKSDLETQLDVATDFLLAKADIKSGTALTGRDIETFTEALYVAKQWQMPTTAPALIRAQQAESRCRAQIRLQAGLLDALQDKDFDRMKPLLQEATRLGLDNDLVRRARAVSSNRNGGENGARLGRTSSIKDKAFEINKLSEREFEKKRLGRLAEARKDKHDWWDLDKKGVVRTAESFASRKGNFLSNNVDKKAQTSQLKWSGEVIPKSMTVGCGKSSDRLCKRAVLMNKAILGYCGDIVLPYPSVLVQQVLEAALVDLQLQDELWVQLLKQLTLNPNLGSERRAWMLCCICAACVGPATEVVENAVLNFLAFQVTLVDPQYQDPLHREYARFALRKFESIVIEGPSGLIPTEEEIDAFAKRPPFLASISLPDGSELVREMPVSPDATIGEVVETCCETYGLAWENSFMFGLFKELDPAHVTERRTRRMRRMDAANGLETEHIQVVAQSASGNAPNKAPRASITGGPARRPSLLQRVSLSITRAVRAAPAPPPPRDEPYQQPFPGEEEEVSIFQLESSSNSGIVGSRPGTFQQGPMSRRRASILNANLQVRASAYVVKSSEAKLKPASQQMPDKSVLPLNQDDYLGDVLTKHVATITSAANGASGLGQLVFIFRRSLVYAAGEEPAKSQVKDKGAYTALCYLDAVEELLAGNWALTTKDHVALFAALMIAELRKGQIPSTIYPPPPELISAFIPREWITAEGMDASKWATTVTAQLHKLKVTSGKDCRRALLNEAALVSPTFGLITFGVQREDGEKLVFGCGARGIAMFRDELGRGKVMPLLPHRQVRNVTATAESCTIVLWDDKHQGSSDTVTFTTLQGREIAALIWEFATKCPV
ncbi:hypothetical protein BASA81_001480 [Batrachochytrium salamandrivorans]|nr:hypothetical protein BASA81_001480 [Batrachochytrium salamandrivorans]